MNGAALSRLADLSHSLALDPGAWPDVLGVLGGALRCHFAAAITTSETREDPVSLGVIGFSRDEHTAFLHRWHKRNPVGTRAPVTRAGAVVPLTGALRDTLHRSDMFRHALAPRDIGEMVRLDLLHDRTEIQAISLGRAERAGPFTEEELRFAAAATPHLTRAATVQARLRQERALSIASRAALERFEGSVVLLDRDGGIVHAAPAAARLLAGHDGVRAMASGPSGRASLQATTPACSARLDALIAQAAGRGGVPPASGSMRLPRPSFAPDLIAVAMPLDAALRDRAGPAVILQLLDPEEPVEPAHSVLADAFGLTAAEVRLAGALLGGQDLKIFAARTGRSVATARTQLASLFAKTRTNRQSELIKLLARLPRS